MGQVSWRASDELVERVRSAARRDGRSMNDFITHVLDAATHPDTAADDAKRVRERLALFGHVVMPTGTRKRPDPALLAEAARKAAIGTPVSSLIER